MSSVDPVDPLARVNHTTNRQGGERCPRLLAMATIALRALAALSLAGCVSRGAIPVTKLPAEYQAEAASRVKTLDLARVAQPVDDEPRIHSGDILEVSVSNLFQPNETETIPVRVEDDGKIRLPMLDPIDMTNMTTSESEQLVRVSYMGGNLLRNPQVMVRLVKQKTNEVFVIGAVNSPGRHSLPVHNSDLLSAIMAAGGLTENAGTVVEIRRRVKSTPPRRIQPKQPTTARMVSVVPAGHDVEESNSSKKPGVINAAAWEGDEIPDLLAASEKEEEEKAVEVSDRFIRLDLDDDEDLQRAATELRLVNGDVISIEPRKFKPFYVSGSVNKPGEFEMPPDRDVRVLEAISLAGGVIRTSNPKNALLIREVEGKDPVVIHLRLDKARRSKEHNIRLMAGDNLVVEEDAVSTIVGIVRETFRIGASVPLW